MGKSTKPVGGHNSQTEQDRSELPGADSAASAGAYAGKHAERSAGARDRNAASADNANLKTSAQAQIGVETQSDIGKQTKTGKVWGEKPDLFGSTPKTEPPKKSHHKKKPEAAKLSAGEAGEAAAGLIEMVELFAVARFGPEAAFSVQERLFIEPSLARIVERYGSVAQQFSFLMDPIMLAVGVGLYGARIVGLAKAQPKSETKGEDYPLPSPTSLDNGDNGVLPTAPDNIWDLTGGKF